MKKIKLAIDIDEILRSKWLAFDRYYDLEFGDEGITEPFDSYDLLNHYNFTDIEEKNEFLSSIVDDENFENVSPHEYVIDKETGKAPIDDILFKTEIKFLTKEQAFNRFLYEDYVYEIHGSAPKIYVNADVDLNIFMTKYSEDLEYIFYSKIKKQAISPTLFFLSKMKTIIKSVVFIENDVEIWDYCDAILTTDPGMLASNPNGKFTIKIDRLYNQNIKAHVNAFGITSLTDEDGISEMNDLIELIKTEKNKNEFKLNK